METLNVRKWYTDTFPTDDLGLEIYETANFLGLIGAIYNGEDVYEYLGVHDSLVRERVFLKLSESTNLDYNLIYNKWLES